ncbi:MAG: radical SAM family heme chaperone HemW [Pirellulales bacterium]|nr:radical SAM family heme chaperone HemW [Pirellulales bacterium]
MTADATWPEPRSVYVHVPFCARRCGYCNFTLVAGRDDLVEPYLQAIERELQSLAAGAAPREIDTLFFGGGTPTQLSSYALRRLVGSLHRQFALAPSYEFSVEVNPADFDAEKADLLAELGVTRISLGAQSFEATKLRTLERDHSPDEVRRAFALARERFPSVSLDLIFAAPGETLAGWQTDLDAALELSPDHVSTYGLTFERGTTFWGRLDRGDLAAAPEELERDMYARAIDRLTAAGFEHYEVSNFARAGHRCRHNEIYWTGGSYHSFGPGAARYVDGERSTNHRSTTTYLKRLLAGESAVEFRERLEPEDRARELLVFGLRRLEGVGRDDFLRSTGFDLERLVGRELQRHLSQGWLIDDGKMVRLTRAGLFVSDALWPDYLRV